MDDRTFLVSKTSRASKTIMELSLASPAPVTTPVLRPCSHVILLSCLLFLPVTVGKRFVFRFSGALAAAY
jgi:hypothetical protein